MDPANLVVVANTGDDFEHLGYRICPDIDTLVYTLSGKNNQKQGWGRADETWEFMEKLRTEQPEDAWFLLGDKDLLTHWFRRDALASGLSLSEVTAQLVEHFGVTAKIVPMTDDPVHTYIRVEGEAGDDTWLPFQEYFVRRRCEPKVRAVEFRGAEEAAMSPGFREALGGDLEAVVICPSNPYLSVDPILSLPGVRDTLHGCGAPVVAVSPVVGGKAIKGPTTKMMRELGLESDVASIARHYADVIDGLVVDATDQGAVEAIAACGVRVTVTQTVMRSLEDREQLARDTLDFARSLQ